MDEVDEVIIYTDQMYQTKLELIDLAMSLGKIHCYCLTISNKEISSKRSELLSKIVQCTSTGTDSIRYHSWNLQEHRTGPLEDEHKERC